MAHVFIIQRSCQIEEVCLSPAGGNVRRKWRLDVYARLDVISCVASGASPPQICINILQMPYLPLSYILAGW